MIYLLIIIFYLPARILFPTKVVGRENLIKGKAIMICNHRSLLDPIMMVALMPSVRFSFMGKKELFKGRFKSWFLKSIGVYPVDRQNVDLTSIKHTLTILKNNKPVVIFPEGTRNKQSDDSEMLQLKNGVSMFAIKGDSPIVPMYFEKKVRLFRFNRFYIGQPFNLSEYKGEKLTQPVLDAASEKIKENLDKLREKSLAKGK